MTARLRMVFCARLALATLALGVPLLAPAAYAGTVISSDVSDVAVTIYRDPQRREGQMARDWPGGYALITETRTVRLPAGESQIRFEGVAEGLLPESAIVSGLPQGVREKNRDARLISPAGLVDAYLKRKVHLRRTDRKTGRVTETDAIIQAGPNGGVILQTSEGFEALGCAGLPERMLYDQVPADLSARPTLSVLATSDRPVTATVQLTYLAQGFDWSANYIAEHQAGTYSLFAWLTIANGGAQSFANARLQVVAGQPNKGRNRRKPSAPPVALNLQCWPMDTTATHPRWGLAVPPPPPQPMMMEAMADIVVTGVRSEARMMSMAAPVAMKAEQEELGDLKLYRVPERVTVAAKAQKQVAMISEDEVGFDRLYTARIDDLEESPRPLGIVLRTQNQKARGLGLPLPAGRVAIFEASGARPLLLGEDDLADKAIAEEVELALGQSPDVQARRVRLGESVIKARWRITLSNARADPVSAEIVIPYELASKPAGMTRGKGGWIWKGQIPANGTTEFDYRLRLGRTQ